jgi:hypothetical protein
VSVAPRRGASESFVRNSRAIRYSGTAYRTCGVRCSASDCVTCACRIRSRGAAGRAAKAHPPARYVTMTVCEVESCCAPRYSVQVHG